MKGTWWNAVPEWQRLVLYLALFTFGILIHFALLPAVSSAGTMGVSASLVLSALCVYLLYRVLRWTLLRGSHPLEDGSSESMNASEGLEHEQAQAPPRHKEDSEHRSQTAEDHGPPNISDSWYFRVDEEQVGPITLHELQGRYRKNDFREVDWVYHPLRRDWMLARDVPELEAASPYRSRPFSVSGSVCTSCGSTVNPERAGGCLIEVILWLFFLIPGLIYSIWRWNAARKCPICGGRVVPGSSPEGMRILRRR